MITAPHAARKFSNLSVNVQIVSAFLFLSAAIGVIGGAAYLLASGIADKVEVYSHFSIPLLNETNALRLETKIATAILADAAGKLEHADFNQLHKVVADLDAVSKQRLANLRALISTSSIEFDLEQTASLEIRSRSLADQVLNALQASVAAQQIARKRLAEFDTLKAQIDRILIVFINESNSQMWKNEDRGKTLIQSGDANFDRLGAILDQTFNRTYRVVEGAYAVRRYALELQDSAREFTTLKDPQSLIQHGAILTS